MNKDWKEEYRKIVMLNYHRASGEFISSAKFVGEVEFFISSLLSLQQEKIAKYLEGKKKYAHQLHPVNYAENYNQALTESAQDVREGKFNQ